MCNRNKTISVVIKAYGWLYILYTVYLWFAPLSPLPGIIAVYNTPFLLALGIGIINFGRWAYITTLVVAVFRLVVLGYFVMTWASNAWHIRTVLYSGLLPDTIATFLIWTIAVFPSRTTIGSFLVGQGTVLASKEFPLLAAIEVLCQVGIAVFLLLNKDARSLFWPSDTEGQ